MGTAKERCAGFGGKLATFGNEAQFEAMLRVRNAIGVNSWVGIDDLNAERHWQFVDGDLSFCQGTDCDYIPQWAMSTWRERQIILDGRDCGPRRQSLCGRLRGVQRLLRDGARMCVLAIPSRAR